MVARCCEVAIGYNPNDTAVSFGLRAMTMARAIWAAGKVPGWPKGCKLAHTFLWEYSDNRMKLARLLGRLGVFLT